ncbi:hypothetical protein [Paenibacillus sp. NPDC057934]|uniref:hypothetical protein n=1 Tax=Paenibacillus sp. NPDC057934 TaxID=3346282 RepID=UPI0036DD7BBD
MTSIDTNGSFENNLNPNEPAEFWGSSWINGDSKEGGVSIRGYEPIDGAYHLRLYNGVRDEKAYAYTLSDPIPVTSGQKYDISAFMRYTLPIGSAEFNIIEFDLDGKLISQSGRNINSGDGSGIVILI